MSDKQRNHEVPTSAPLTAEDHLRIALGTSREIGAAIGILMERYSLTYEAAWHGLRRASQNRNVAVRTIATDLVLTGQFDPSCEAGNSSGNQASPDGN